MTRNEAYKLVNAVENAKFDQDLINSLEALGLIKFDEEKTVTTIIREQLQGLIDAPSFKADHIVNALYKAGYKVVKK